MKKNAGQIIILMLLLLTMVFVLSACNREVSIDLSDYVKVTYDCMGGHIDKLPTRTLYAKSNTLIIEPKGNQGFVEAQKTGYSIEGWYIDYTAGEYKPSEDGEYVFDKIYTLDAKNESEYVSYPYYYADVDGLYVGEILVEGGEIVYNLYDVKNETQKELPRYSLITRYKIYDTEDETENNLIRYKAVEGYVYYNENNPDLADLDRYTAIFTFNPEDKWDFETKRIGDESVTLYAHWVRNLKIDWNYNNGTDDKITYENGKLDMVIERGNLIAETKIVPKKSEYTFTYWYKSADCTERWDFATDVYPEDEAKTTLDLYAGYVAGEYKRITNLRDFNNIEQNLSGKYILLTNLDISENTTIGCDMDEGDIFTGEFNGNGNTITGLNLNALNRNKTLYPKYFGLFSLIEDATIKNINLQGSITINKLSTKTVYAGAIAGKDKGGSTIDNCNINVVIKSNGTCEIDIYAGAYVGKKNNTTLTDCKFNASYGAGIVTTESLTLADI